MISSKCYCDKKVKQAGSYDKAHSVVGNVGVGKYKRLKLKSLEIHLNVKYWQLTMDRKNDIFSRFYTFNFVFSISLHFYFN